MKLDFNDFIIYYNECDKEYVDDLISFFNDEKNNIYDFFGIKCLSRKLNINIYDDMDKYALCRNNNVFNTSVGNMDFDDNNYYINILSYKEFIKREGHQDADLDYFYKTFLHEFIHICHEEIGTYKDSLIWLKEGIAIVLSGQYDGLDYKIDNCSIDDLLNNRRTWYINYYSLVKYAFDKYGIDYVKELVNDVDFQKDEIRKLYSELLEVL